MSDPDTHEVTRLLADWAKGNEQALDDLTPLVYQELRRLAASYLRKERQGHTLQPTALVHEAYLRLVDQTSPSLQNRSHFYGVAARLMRMARLSQFIAPFRRTSFVDSLRQGENDKSAGCSVDYAIGVA